MFCKNSNNKCVKQRSDGDICEKNEECANHLTCANNKCLKIGSLLDYEISDNNLACKSGFASTLGTIGESKCVPTPKIIDK